MDFSWSTEQSELYEQAVRFGTSFKSSAVIDSSQFNLAGWKSLAEFGALGLCAPKEFGGMGLDALSTARVFEGLGYGCPDRGILFAAAAHLFACIMPLAEHGSDALQAKFVPDLIAGKSIAGNALTEPGAGSDIANLVSRAQQDRDDYVLNADKSYVTNGPVADLFLVYAITNESAGHLGVSAFVVSRDFEGVTAGPAFEKLGLGSAPVGALYLDNCRISKAHRVGGEGQGTRIFAGSMKWERACLFAIFLGAMEKQLDVCVAYARDRHQFGAAISNNQAVSHRIADMKLRLEAARLLLYRACWLSDRGGDSTLEISLSKLAVSEAAIRSGLDSIRLHGGLGYAAESGIAELMLDGIGSAIFSGTSDIQRTIIANRLGL